jgi:tetratricopeptide (TPR) repeat protein
MDQPVNNLFSLRRKQAIEFVNQGVIDTNGANGLPKNPQLGYQKICSAVEIDPTFAHGWFNVGNANGDLKLGRAAVAAYRRALQMKKGTEIGDLTANYRAHCLCNLGHSLYHLGKLDEAKQHTLASIEMDNKLAFSWINLSMIQSMQGEDEAAEVSARKAHFLDSGNAAIEVGLAFSLLHQKKYEEGLRAFEARYPYKLTHFLQYPYPQWKGENGAELFLCSDQGLGDSIDFLRFVPEVQKRCKHVWLGCQQELISTVQAMFGHYENFTFLPLPQPFPPATHWAALMSLPTALRLNDKQIANTPMPECKVPDTAAPWKNENAKFHVGIAWAGSPMNEVDQYRSASVDNFLELARVPNVQLYSLQVGERAPELHIAGAATILKDLSAYIRTVMDTLSILKHLDMVICVDTGVGHMAGMMDVETWIPVAYNGCCWRFTRHGESALWYGKHRLFRQGADAKWEPVFENIVAELDRKVNG